MNQIRAGIFSSHLEVNRPFGICSPTNRNVIALPKFESGEGQMERERILTSGCYFACLTFFLLRAPAAAHAATYYIDFASGADTNAGTSKSAPWKHAPGMTGCTSICSSQAINAGDSIILKGGVTWDSTVFNWTISKGGSVGNPVYYGVDQTWFSGGVWTQPILDGGGSLGASNRTYVPITGSYITIDNLKVQNIGQAYYFKDDKLFVVANKEGIRITNCTIAPNVRVAIWAYSTTPGVTYSDFTFDHNDISSVSWGIAVATTAVGAVMANVNIYNNTIHDFTTQMCGGVHGDGIITYNGAVGTGTVTPINIYNNVWYGDFHVDGTKPSCVDNDTPPSVKCITGPPLNPCGMNAWIFMQDEENATINIYNNVASYTNARGWLDGAPTQMNALLTLMGDTGYSNNYYVYNNSFWADVWVDHGLYLANTSSFIFKNNIIVGTDHVLMPTDNTSCLAFTADADYNAYYNWVSSLAAMPAACGGFQTWTQYHLTNGKEPHSMNANPLFVSSTNLNLQSGSPAINAATNLYSVFTADAAGNPRPASGAWDMGAYEYQATAPRPNPPTNLRVTEVH
jgi:hypothetical protein